MRASTSAGSVFPVSEIGQLIQAYQDKHGTSDRALALRVGVTATLIGKWKKGRFAELPKADRIEALAAQMALPKVTVIEAFLRDLDYLPQESDGDDRTAAPMNEAHLSEVRPRVVGDDLAGLPSVAHKPRKQRPKND